MTQQDCFFYSRFIKCLLLIMLLPLAGQLQAQGNIDISYYWDNRDFNTATLQISKNDIPNGFSFWGFTDLHSAQDNSKQRDDFSRSFSEYRLTNDLLGQWTDIKDLKLQLEYNDATPGNSNHLLRFGVTYQLIQSSQGWLQLRVFPWQSRHHGQLSVAYFYRISDNLNISGFTDYNLNSRSDNEWIYEPQLNYRLLPNFWLLLEYRYNGYEENNPTLDGSGMALGFRYQF
ncbi:hypothetical protein [Aliikangiella maris]|uniref:Porin n=2 Tax=Aliikangiella maris TaxID=3162458 RepID=A0ABV2BXX6_9GAMM